MKRFSTRDRDEAMTHTVSYQRVPIPRGNAFALYHIAKHGGSVDLFSGIRVDKIVAEHNREFHTTLSGQQHLVDLWRAGKGNPANSPSTTSHCWRSDGNPAYRVDGKQIPTGGELPWYMIGLDLADVGEFESVDEFLAAARHLGYHVVQPYPVGGERHHVVFTQSPIAVLERANVISKDRG